MRGRGIPQGVQQLGGLLQQLLRHLCSQGAAVPADRVRRARPRRRWRVEGAPSCMISSCISPSKPCTTYVKISMYCCVCLRCKQYSLCTTALAHASSVTASCTFGEEERLPSRIFWCLRVNTFRIQAHFRPENTQKHPVVREQQYEYIQCNSNSNLWHRIQPAPTNLPTTFQVYVRPSIKLRTSRFGTH